MKKIEIVNEFDLLRFARCPLYLARIDHARESADSAAVDAAAEDLLRWITWEAEERGVPDLQTVRRRADAFFTARYAGEMTLPIGRRLVRVSRRLHDLVSFNAVLHPVTPYQLDLGLVRIEGSLAILTSKTKASQPPRIIRLRNQTIKHPIIPDIVSVARWLFGQRESGYPRCVVYNYSLSGETVANQQFTEQVAQRWLTAAAMNWLNARVYPSPGDHCQSCQRPCLTLPQMIMPA